MGNRDNRFVARIHLREALTVVMGSIGSDVRYQLKTRNISNSGFFLDFEKPGRFPFTPASIMEVWMELEEGKTIFFNGKMARVVYPQDEGAQVSGPGIAIRIVQIETEQEKRLCDFIEHKQQEYSSEPEVTDEAS